MPYEPKGEKAHEHIPGAPQDVQDTYNAIMRDKFHGDDSDENQSQAAAIAWSQHNKKHKSAKLAKCPKCGAEVIDDTGEGKQVSCSSCGWKGSYQEASKNEKNSAANETINGVTPKEDQSFKCPHCEAVLQSNVGYELCPYCGMTIASKKSAWRTRQWQCPECGEWDYEGLGSGGHGRPWHDCKNCGYSEKSPTDIEQRYAPLDWDEDEQGAYDYDDWYDREGNPHVDKRLSNYKVIALGEMQQPGGVGATQTTGLTDGLPKSNQEEGEELSTDAGKNSFEQNVALETWVNFAVDMLNRATDEQQILAQLAHDGCPDPQGVLERAKKQPFDNTPVEGAEDPFEVPFKEDGYDEQQESVERQPPVTQSVASWQPDPRRIYRTSDKITLDDIGGPIGEADKPKDADMSILQDVDGPSDEDQADLFDTDDPDKTDNSTPPIKFKEKVEVQEVKDYPKSSKVHIKNTSWRGIVLDQYEDLWGQKLAKVALADGGTVTVAPSQLEVDDPLAANDPVGEIQTFIDNLPVVEPTRPSIMSHITNLEMVRRACRANISKVGFSDQLKLEEFDRRAQQEIGHLKEAFSNTTNDYDSEYLASLPRYQSGDGSRQQDDAFNSRLNERAAIFVSELPLEVRQDAGQLAFAAARFADKNNGNIPAFVTAAQHWAKDWEKPWEKSDEDEDNDDDTETKE